MLVDVGGRSLKLSNLHKVLYPATGTTKAEVLDYYARIAPVLLPHLADRAVTRRRFPDGVDGEAFYEKNCPSHRPDWMETFPIVSEDGATIDFCRIDSVAALTWMANLAAIELHTSMARATDSHNPTMVVFDLDPGPPAAILDCADIALWLHRVLAGLGLRTLVKTSGSKGMQVYLPLNGSATYEATAGFSRTLAQLLERQDPDRVVSIQRKDRRTGKILIDWSQNSWHKTTACVYTMRARERPTVSTPLSWDEVAHAVEEGDASLLTFEITDVLDRVERLGDLFAPATTLHQELPALPAG